MDKKRGGEQQGDRDSPRRNYQHSLVLLMMLGGSILLVSCKKPLVRKAGEGCSKDG